MELSPRARTLRPCLLGALLSIPLGDGRSYRLNDPFPVFPDGDVEEFELSPDGTRLAYWVENDESGAHLFTLPTDLSTGPVQVTDPAFFGGPHSSPLFTSDGARLLFTWDRGTISTITRLYSAPGDGSGTPVLLIDRAVGNFQLTPDGQRVLFICDFVSVGRFVLGSMPVDGSAPPIVVNGPMTYEADVFSFRISPDNTHVVYRADAIVNGRYDLFSARVDVAGSGILLSATQTGFHGFYQVSADGARAVFQNPSGSTGHGLFSVLVDGSAAPVQLNLPLVSNRNVEWDFALSPDSTRVVYRADHAVDDVLELYSVPIDGSAPPTTLSPALVAGGDVQTGPAVSPDGARVVYRADQSADEVVELYSVPIDGSAAAVKLNAPLAAGEDVQGEFTISPDGTRVAFLAGTSGTATLHSVLIDASAAPAVLDADPLPMSELRSGANSVRLLYRKWDPLRPHLWSAPLDGSAAAVQVSGGSGLGSFRIGPSGAGVAYTADQDFCGVFELFARGASGAGSTLQLSAEFPTSLVVGSAGYFDTRSDRALYAAVDACGVVDVFSVPISGRGGPVRISATSGAPIQISNYPLALGAGGVRAVFVGSTRPDPSARELYSAPVDGSTEPLVLNGAMQPNGAVQWYELSGDGSQVVYLADQDTDNVVELYRAAIGVAASSVKLSGTITAGGVGPRFQVNADGSRVIYVANQNTGTAELFSATGAAPPVKLSGPMVAGGNVQLDPLLSGNGSRVFYRADQNVDETFELFGVASDGSSGFVPLSGTIVAEGDVSPGFRATPDGSWVVFIADRETDGKPELYSRLGNGGGSVVKLTPTGPLGRYATGFVLDPTGTWVVFRYNPNIGNHMLYRAPVDGSSAAVLLTPMASDREVLEAWFQVSPDGARVVYFSNQDGPYDLFSVPIDLSAPAVKIVGYPAGAGEFHFDPAGELVVYRGNTYPTEQVGVFVVPIDGSRAPVRLDRTSPVDGDVQSDFAIATDGSAVLFRQDVRQLQSFDLYAAPLVRQPRSGSTPTITVTRQQ